MSDDNKLLKKLEAFYKLAIIQPHEEGDDARLNEARTSAYLLIKTARENGVRIKFLVPPPERKKSDPPPRRPPDPGSAPHVYWGVDPMRGNWSTGDDPFGDLFTEVLRQEAQRRAQEQAARDRERAARESADFRRRNAPKDPPFTRPQSQGSGRYDKRPAGGGDRPPIITAAFGGICHTCNRRIGAGERVYWVRAVGISHEACGYEDLREVAGDG